MSQIAEQMVVVTQLVVDIEKTRHEHQVSQDHGGLSEDLDPK